MFLYDNFPGGIGLSEPLFKRRTELVRAALDLVDACECAAGCPACVGPALQVDEEHGVQAAGPKALAQRVLGHFLGEVDQAQVRGERAKERLCVLRLDAGHAGAEELEIRRRLLARGLGRAFLGQALAQRLGSEGHRVQGLVRGAVDVGDEAVDVPIAASAPGFASLRHEFGATADWM